MSYPNPTQPIIIQANTLTTSKSDFALRRFCFVSAGDTDLDTGEIAELDSNNWSEKIHKESALYKEIEAFFVYTSTSKICYVLETQNTNNEISISVNENCEFSKDNQTITSLNIKEGDLLNINAIEGVSVVVDIEFLTLQNNAYLAIKSGNTSISATKTSDSEESISKQLQVNISAKDLSANIEVLNQHIKDNVFKMYMYGLSEAFYKDSNIASVLSHGLDINNPTIFVFSLKNLTSFTSDISSGNRGIIVLYDNAIKYPILGAFGGIFTNSQFDISSDNPASPFCYKLLQGNTYNTLTSAQSDFCTKNGISFVGDIGGNVCFLGGRTGDMRTIDFWYQWDLLNFFIKEDWQSLLLSGVNNPRYTIPFSQSGIDIGKSKIENTLDNKGKAYGLITEYAQGYNNATNELLGNGSIYNVSFVDYIKAKPHDYQNGIYGGYSAFIQIQKYILQIVFPVTLG